VDKKVNEVDWDELATLKSLREPSQGLPRLVDLLRWLAEPGQEKTWVLLDIKVSHASLSSVVSETDNGICVDGR
jgi:phosphatidylglycerol phospholipase C